MADNGAKDWWIRWLVGIIWGIVILALTTLGSNVIANERGNVDKHAKTNERVSQVEQSQERMNTDIAWIKEGIKTQNEDIKEMKRMVRDMYQRS